MATRLEHPTLPAYRACVCGLQVLTGETFDKQTLVLDVTQRTYVVIWQNGEPAPQLRESAAYPVHVCPPLEERMTS